MVEVTIPHPPPDVQVLMRDHDLEFVGSHTNLQVSWCVCRVVVARPAHDGEICYDCGGIMVRTGTCYTCTSCGTTGGCG